MVIPRQRRRRHGVVVVVSGVVLLLIVHLIIIDTSQRRLPPPALMVLLLVMLSDELEKDDYDDDECLLCCKEQVKFIGALVAIDAAKMAAVAAKEMSGLRHLPALLFVFSWTLIRHITCDIDIWLLVKCQCCESIMSINVHLSTELGSTNPAYLV